MMKLGINLFGSSAALYRDFSGTLDSLRTAGYSDVEICVMFGVHETLSVEAAEAVLGELTGGIWPEETAAEQLRQVRAAGFAVSCCHMMTHGMEKPEDLEDLLPRLIAFAEHCGIQYYISSLFLDLTQLDAYVPVLNYVTETLAEHGVRFLYHNHAVEGRVENGTSVLDELLRRCPQIDLKIDAGWLQIAGVHPAEFIRRHRDRIVLLHLKDMPADFSEEKPSFVAVGEGELRLESTLAAAKGCPVIVDQDNSRCGDILSDLRLSVQNLNKQEEI